MALEPTSELALKAFLNMALQIAMMRYEDEPLSDKVKAYMRAGYDRLAIDNTDGCSMLGYLTYPCPFQAIGLAKADLGIGEMR